MWPTFGSRLPYYSRTVSSSSVSTQSPAPSPTKDLVSSSNHASPQLQQDAARVAERQLEESMALIADEDKQEYLEAVRLAPHLVATESNPLRFLRSDRMNPWSAATRLATYWKHRKEVFLDRWLLPLDLSGNGALSPSDVENIKKNVLLIRRCPGAPTVIYADYGRAPNQDDLFACRTAFFAATLVTEEESSKGMYLMQQLAPQFFMRRRKKGQAIEIIRNALPVRFRKIFLMKRQGASFGDAIFDSSLCMMAMIAEFFFGDAPEFISDARKKEGFERFQALNLPPSCIPFYLGGSWDLESGSISQDAYQGPVCPSPIMPAAQRSSASHSLLGSNAKPKTRRGRPPKVLSQECAEEMKAECGDDAEFIKKRNALYSRRLYYKKKQQKEELQGKIDQLQSDNERLRKNNEWLEGLLAEARVHVHVPSDDMFSAAAEKSIMAEFGLFSSTAISAEVFSGEYI